MAKNNKNNTVAEVKNTDDKKLKVDAKETVKNAVEETVKNDTKKVEGSKVEETKKAEDVKKEVKPENEKKQKEAIKQDTKKAKELLDKIEFARLTRIEKSSNNRTIKNLFRNREKLRFDLAIQRGEVWTLDQKSMLIHSILYGFPVPPVMVQETDDDNIWFLDGKQRLTTIIGYLNGDFAISKNTPPVFGHKIAGYKFKDLPEDMQDVISEETITLIKLKNMNDEERDEMFVRWNSGSSLSKIELTRAMHSALIEQINHIAELEFFAEDIALTSKARNRFVDQEIILQIAMLLDEGRDNMKGFGSTQVKDYVLRLKEVDQILSTDLVKKFEDVSKYLNMAVSVLELVELKKALKKIHVPIVFYTAIKAMEIDVKPILFGEFIRAFLVTNYSVESDYGQSCQAGSSKKENVQTRLSEMDLALTEFALALEEYPENTQRAVEAFEKEWSNTIKKQISGQGKEDKKEAVKS